MKTGQFFKNSFLDADYAGCSVDRKSTSGTCQFLENYLVSWSSTKQNSVTLSTTKAEYVAAGACCAQVLWMKHIRLDYDCIMTILKYFVIILVLFI